MTRKLQQKNMYVLSFTQENAADLQSVGAVH
jgi:hypothetical protein